jgi:beta-galactosidase GanA
MTEERLGISEIGGGTAIFWTELELWAGEGRSTQRNNLRYLCAKLRIHMRNLLFTLPILMSFLCLETAVLSAQTTGAPHLEKRGAATQLILDGKPFLMLSGELHNSSSSNLEYMKPIWPRLKAMSLNSVVTPLSWELIEPKEGSYDFALVDGLIEQARDSQQKIVFLWLASWKNGLSSYEPVWVKQDTKRFPRMVLHSNPVEILSPQGAATEEADARAFAALMKHIKVADGSEHTVVMMQIENEVGVLGDSRDHSEAANKAFASAVPAELTAYLKAHRETLYPDLKDWWDANGNKTAGTWTEVFGDSERADEIFMAWHYARYIHAVAKAGKAEYDIPMYANTWLMGDTTPPGEYPSGGAEPRVMDVWRAAGPGLDFYSPDIYAPNFTEWSRRYHRDGNPLYVPETRGGELGAANVFYALGEEAGLGFSAWAIDSEASDTNPLGQSYKAIAGVAPLLAEAQSKGDVHGFLLDNNRRTANFTMNGVTLHLSLDKSFGSAATSAFGLIMATGKNEFVGVGKGFRVTFVARADGGQQVGIAGVDEGTYEDGKWVAGRRLNGDENEQGVAWRFDSKQVRTEKVELYRF